MEAIVQECEKEMITEEKCLICNNQDIMNENHVREIDGELIRLCPICYHSME